MQSGYLGVQYSRWKLSLWSLQSEVCLLAQGFLHRYVTEVGTSPSPERILNLRAFCTEQIDSHDGFIHQFESADQRQGREDACFELMDCPVTNIRQPESICTSNSICACASWYTLRQCQPTKFSGSAIWIQETIIDEVDLHNQKHLRWSTDRTEWTQKLEEVLFGSSLSFWSSEWTNTTFSATPRVFPAGPAQCLKPL